MTELYHETRLNSTLNYDPNLGHFVARDNDNTDPVPVATSGPGLSHSGLSLADRYRLAALKIVDPERRQYYLDRAAELGPQPVGTVGKVLAYLKFATGCVKPAFSGNNATTRAAGHVKRLLRPADGDQARRYIDKALSTLTTVPADQIPNGLRRDIEAFKADPLTWRGSFDHYLPRSTVATTTATAEAVEPKPLTWQQTVGKQVRLWSVLGSQFVVQNLTRPGALWAVLRTTGRSWLPRAEVVDYAMAETGKARSTCYGWLSSGDGIFWNVDPYGRLFLIGKDRVFDHLLGVDVKPGAVVLVPTDRLLSRKKHAVAAALASTWVTADNGKFAARSTRRNSLQGVPERTQYNYDKTAGVRTRRHIYTYKGRKLQGSHHYRRPAEYFTPNKKRRSKTAFFGRRAADYNGTIGGDIVTAAANGDKARCYYSDVKRAVEAAKIRQQQGVMVPVYVVRPIDPKNPSNAVFSECLYHPAAVA